MRHTAMILVVTSCLSAFAGGRTLAQTAEELVNKNIQAKGGLEKIKSARSRLTAGKGKGAGRRRSQGSAFRKMKKRPHFGRPKNSMHGMTPAAADTPFVGWATQPLCRRPNTQ